MKTVFLSLIVLLSGIASLQAGEKVNSDKSKHHIYLLIGQSNMAGRAPFSGDDKKPVDGVFLLNDKNEWVPASNPFNRYSTIRKDLKMQKMNPGYSFSKSMVKNSPGATIGLVVNAKGGTRIAQWKKGTKFFKDAIARTKKAMETGTLKGILWHQGEGDSKNDKYLQELTQLIKDLRADLGQSDLPFVAGEIKQQVKLINDQLNKLPSVLPHTAVVTSKELSTLDGTHFDTASVKVFGERYAEAMLGLQNSK